MRRLGTGTGFAVAKLSEVLPLQRALLASVRMTEKRFGTGTGFAFAKLSEVLPRSERSLATVRMTDRASVARFGEDDKERCVATRAT